MRRAAFRLCPAFAVVALVACTTGPSGTSSPSSSRPTSGVPISCGEPVPLVGLGSGKVAKIGPLLFLAFTNDQQQAQLPDYQPGVPTKVPIRPEEPLTAPVTLTGARCTDGHPLRFWYRGPLPWSPPVSTTVLDATGDLMAQLEPQAATSSGTPVAYSGYMLFTETGKWLITVHRDRLVMGSEVFQVGA